RFGGPLFRASGSLLASDLSGDPAAITALERAPERLLQRPGQHSLPFDSTRTHLRGLIATAAVDKLGGGPWRWSALARASSPGVDLNDVGFMQSTDWLLERAQLRHETYGHPGPVRDRILGIAEWSGWTFGGERRATGLGATTSLTLRSGGTLLVEGTR